MKTLSVTHEIKMAEEVYWRLVFDATYNEALYKALGCSHYKLLEENHSLATVTYKLEVEPDLSHLLPAIQMLVKAHSRYTEVGFFDKKTRRYSFRADAFGGKVITEGVMTCKPVGHTGYCNRTLETSVTAQGPFGPLLESNVIVGLEKGYERGAAFTNGYALPRHVL